MASGPEHYQRAQECLAAAFSPEMGEEEQSVLIAAAQVHATLALAAACGLNDAHGGKPDANHLAWRTAAASAHTPQPPA